MKTITFREARTNMKVCLLDYEVKNIKRNNDNFIITNNSGANFVANYLMLENIDE